MLYIPPISLLLAAKQVPYKKYERIFWKKFRRMDQLVEQKYKTERVTRLGRRAREGIEKWSQMTALRW